MLHKNGKKVISGLLGSCLMLQLATLPSLAQAPQPQNAQDGVLLDATAQWKYLDNNTDPAGTAGTDGYDIHSWTAADFDDSSWKTAAGPFGSKRGGADLGGGFVASTVLEGCDGKNDYTTYFFRTTFTLDSLDGVTKLEGALQHDDGAIVYINGQQVASYDVGDLTGTNNMEYAGVSAGDPQTQTFTVTDLSMLQEGENTIAVEVHNDRQTSSDIWFNFTQLSTSQEPVEQNFTDVLLSVGADNTQMNATWYATQEEAGYVLVAKESELVDGAMPEGAAQFAATSTPANDSGKWSNQVTITGLEPGTTYAYQLVTGNITAPVATFTTATNGAFSFAFAGDPQIGASGNAASDTEGWGKTLGLIADSTQFDGVDFLLSAGDQVNTASNEEQYNGYLDHDELLSLPVATVVGNHDSSSNAYDQHFNVPNESQLGVTNAGGDYWFVYNNTLFMVLNSNSMSTAEHKAFMEQAIAQAGDVDWKVVTFHHSVYSVASHAVDGDILQRREALVPVFDQLDIDVVLMGHDHVYVRTYMMDGLTPITQSDKYTDTNGDGIPESVTNPDGILYVTANSASGSKFYTIQNTKYEYSAVQNQERVPNISRVDVSEDAFTITTYRTSDMSVVDTFTINHTAPAAANKGLLEYAYHYALEQDTTNLIPAVEEKFQAAMDNAKAVLDDANATQAEVDAAFDQLVEAVHMLSFTRGDKTMLELLIARADGMVVDADKYVEANWQQLVDALARAKDVYADENAMDGDIQPVVDELLAAILAQRFKADKSILEGLIAEAEGVDLTGYTAESVATFRSALAQAQAVLADESLTEDDQQTVDAAVEALTAAVEGLTAQGEAQPSQTPEVSQKPETTDQPQATQKPENSVPQTGDHAQLGLMLSILVLSAAGMAAVVTLRKRRG